MSKKKLVLSIFIAVTAATLMAASPIALPGCQDKCGDVLIPYPFGLNDRCSFDENFSIFCNTTHFTPPKPFFKDSNIDLLDISLDGQLRIHTYVATDCYNHQGEPQSDQSYNAQTTLAVFPFSYTRNTFVGIGCDTYAFLYGKDNYGRSNVTGCMSLCNSLDSVQNGSCDGIGCCQTPIPKNQFTYNISVGSSVLNHTEVWEFNNCSYSFVVEEVFFNFSIANFSNINIDTEVPTVVDWAIGKQTCEEAKKNLTSYACKENSVCYDPDNGWGYRCNCSAGYQGNPYLPDGCQDFDECMDPTHNDCKGICINTPGKYTCSCPEGYYGDGRKDGEGCISYRDQLQVVEIIVGVGLGLMLLLVVSTSLYFGLDNRKLIKLKAKYFEQNGGIMLQQRLAGHEGPKDVATIYSAKELNKATNNFDESRIIGKGGYGIVYKGTLPGNKIVAIKKSKIVDKDQIEQFINEVVVLSQINHRNVVKLMGCCLETEVPLLVYEFVSNGTLYSYIHDESKASAFSWELRLRIAAETAGVLAYLHSEASIPIIHRDVKSNNILLDDHFTAKVSDFGASRLVPMDQAQISTVVQGTLGYLDPEYMLTSQLTEKSDVYSFGVVLVELLTGENVFSNGRPGQDKSLAFYFLSALKMDRLFEVIANCVAKEENKEQLNEVAILVKRCLSVKGEERPTMKEVAMKLEGLRMLANHPLASNKESINEVIIESLGPSHAYDHGDSGETSVGYDSFNMKGHVALLPMGGGR